MTEKLYEQDAYLTRFSALVRSCAAGRAGWEITLDRTAFYPEGGGQPGDTGTLGGVTVRDTQARGGEVVHICDGPLEEGTRTEGLVDWARRFDLMQQHSGEHIVSGLICARYGCDNVGFHLGAEAVVIDFNHPVTAPELPEIEAEANRVIWENRPFLVSYPSPEELRELSYRSKKELSGAVRIVSCPGADTCACCGTHVRSAGELGLLLLTGVKPFREGARITLLAGARAYAYARAVEDQNHAVSVLTSAKERETAGAVRRLLDELAAERYRAVGLENRLFDRIAAGFPPEADVLLVEEGLSPDALRRLCERLSRRCRGLCAVFSPAAEGRISYAAAQAEGDIRALVREMNAALNGRGGGKQPGFAQGSLRGTQAELAAFFAAKGLRFL